MEQPSSNLEKAQSAKLRILTGTYEFRYNIKGTDEFVDEIDIIKNAIAEQDSIFYLLNFKTQQNFESFSSLYYIQAYGKALAYISENPDYQTKDFYEKVVLYFEEKSPMKDVAQFGFHHQRLQMVYDKILSEDKDSENNHGKSITDLLTVGNVANSTGTSISPDSREEEEKAQNIAFTLMLYGKMQEEDDPTDSYNSMMEEMESKGLTVADLKISEAELKNTIHDTFNAHAERLLLLADSATEEDQRTIIADINEAYKIAGIDKVINEFGSKKNESFDESITQEVKNISSQEKGDEDNHSIGVAIAELEDDFQVEGPALLDELLDDGDNNSVVKLPRMSANK